MEYISDILLGLGALAAAFYCVVLSRKLNRLSGLDQELGTAIALLSQQVDEMTKVLQDAQTSADAARTELTEITERAENVALQLNATTPPVEPAFATAAIAEPPALQETAIEASPDEGGLTEGAPSLFLRHSQAAQ